MNLILLSIIVLLYVLCLLITGIFAWKETNSAEDFMVAGRNAHPYIMAMSYGATFISTAAIVGFGGVAGQYGMGILWLVFCNILIGIFTAFVLFGKRTRKIGHNLNALTFPEFLSKRFDSRFIRYFSGLIIFLGMPLYASVVLIGAARFIETTLTLNFNYALIIMAVFVTFYVVIGGIKSVMYTDAMQGTIMFVGMLFLAFATYNLLGGVTAAHTALSNMGNLVPESVNAIGGTGWTSFPTFNSSLWWNMVSTIILGVGVGVLAQPQLVVRFMTVNSDKELNRAVLIGGLFIFVITGSAYVAGSLSNVYFYNTQGILAVDAAGGNIDNIIPLFISSALPEWFAYLFMLTLLSAVLSTLSAQFHVQGTSLGLDIYETFKKKSTDTSILMTRIGIGIAVVIALILGFILPANVIAQGTSLFMSICAAAFLSAYICAVFWKRSTKEGVISGMVAGTFTSIIWLLFIYKKTAAGLGVCNFLFGKTVLISSHPWSLVDPIVIAVPISLIITILVSLSTKSFSKEFIDKCFEGI